MELTQESVKYYFTYSDGFLLWRVKKCPQVSVGNYAGGIKRDNRNGREKLSHVTRVDNKPYYTSRLIFLYHHGWLPEVVDHENHNPLDNRIENLRPADNYKNARNKTSARGSTSKYLGVCLSSGKWVATIYIKGKNKILGRFTNEDDAAKSYNQAAKEHFKEFANLNIINS